MYKFVITQDQSKAETTSLKSILENIDVYCNYICLNKLAESSANKPLLFHLILKNISNILYKLLMKILWISIKFTDFLSKLTINCFISFLLHTCF
jgi:hypothetical protein